MNGKPKQRSQSDSKAVLEVSAVSAKRRPELQEEANTSITAFRAEYFQGPLPHPEDLAEYERICPGAADRILAMAEAQGRHRQKLEELVITSNCKAQARGPFLGFTVAVLTLALGGWLVATGRELSGMVALVGAIAAIVIPFVYGKRAQREALEEKNGERPEPQGEGDTNWDYSLPRKSSDGASAEGEGERRIRPTRA